MAKTMDPAGSVIAVVFDKTVTVETANEDRRILSTPKGFQNKAQGQRRSRTTRGPDDK